MKFETWHIVAVLIAIVLFLCSRKSNTEGYKNFCGNCRDLTLEECANCPNCGICKDSTGCVSCSQGDESGPYYQDDCQEWIYMGKTPSHGCWNYNKLSPYNCGYFYPYNKRVIYHEKYAALKNQLGTKIESKN